MNMYNKSFVGLLSSAIFNRKNNHRSSSPHGTQKQEIACKFDYISKSSGFIRNFLKSITKFSYSFFATKARAMVFKTYSILYDKRFLRLALHIAAAEGHSSIIKLLLEQNCDLLARNMISWLPIHCAAERGRYNSVRTLIENHSPVDPVDKNQQTPLHLAARNGHSDVVKLLLKNGAKINKRTSSGDNCLDLAIGSNQYNVAEILINNRDWELILRNAQHDELTNRWETPLRKLIRKMPDIALIVLGKCCKIIPKNKNDQSSSSNADDQKDKKKKKGKKSTTENIVELREQLNSNNADTSGLTKDETQLQKLTFLYNYEFLDDQFLLKKWEQGTSKLFINILI